MNPWANRDFHWPSLYLGVFLGLAGCILYIQIFVPNN